MRLRSFTRPLAVAVLGAACLLSIPAAQPQTKSPSPAPAPGTANPSSNIPDQKLDAAAAAIQRVATLSRDYQQQIAAAPSSSDKQRIADEGNKAMEKAVTDQGLTVQEYNSIVEEAQANPAVHQKILQRLQPSTNQPSTK